ncbi:two-component regulator propeller domain-containing protein [Hyalangium minutum]|nr:two-component regulator propeller domain-containing protein [Hyalangium minutum]
MGTRRQGRRGGRRLLGLWFVLALGLGTPSFALEPGRSLSQYNHESWRSENGLPQNSVLCAEQTADGYLWFGTYEGLARFDGTRFTTFDQRTSPEMGQREIHALVEDDAAVLWVGTSQGLFRYERGQLRRPPEAAALANVPIVGLAADGQDVWISSPLGVMRAPSSGQRAWRRYSVDEGLPVKGTGPIVVDGSGGAWVGAGQGLARITDDSVDMLFLPPGESPIKPLYVLSLWLSREGTLWIGTNQGLLALREGQFTRYGPEQGMPNVAVGELREDRDGNLWIGTYQGLLRRTGETFSAVTASKELAHALVASLLEDRDGHLWIGTGTDGLHRLSNGPFIPIGAPEGSVLENVRMVLETPDGTLWMASNSQGLERMKDGVIRRVGAEEGLLEDRIRTLALGSDGALWVGTSSGAYYQQGGRFVPLGTESGMPPGAVIFAMVPEPDGDMWFSTSEGLAWLSNGRVTLYPPEKGTPADAATALVREESGVLWYGTKKGLVRFDRGTLTRFTTQEGLAGNVIMSLFVDAHGTLWVGTSTGLSRWKDGRFASVTAAQGLPDETIFNLLLDAEGFFWMSSNKGVSRVSRHELEAVADGKLPRVSGVLFDERDGMRAGECNAGLPSGWETRDGRMWFANLRGAMMVNTKDVRLRHSPPHPRIEEVRVQGQPVPLSGLLELEPEQQDVDIRFTAFVKEGAPRVQFRYMLEGHDRAWVEAEGRRVATYTRLPPGRYTFRVQAMDRTGNWVAPGAVLEVVLRAWFYQSAWFYGLCALGAGGMAAGIYAWRVGRLKRRERWLQARVEERTQELARANEELDANLRTLRATQVQLVQAGKMAAVGTLAAGVGHEINNPLSYIVSNLEHSCEETETLAQLAESSEPLRERLRDMHQVLREALMGADRVRRIVRDLKTFSRQDDDARGPVDLRAVMDSAAKMAAGELRPRAQLTREYAAEVPPVEGNEARLSQVFLNLIINAAQALPEGRPEQHEVRLVLKHGAQGEVVAEVRDTGCGIPPEVLGRIFDPFFTTKPVGVGTGLGLALCHAFVTSMGGRIEVESQVGKGTVFRVALPRSSSQLDRVQRSAPVQAGTVERGQVLVVDDDPLVSAALRRTLAKDHEVEVVVSARRALEMLCSPKAHYDVILCDLMMPEMTGMELYAQLVRAAPEQARRMVFITGGAYTPAAKEFLEQVSNPRVEKPFDPERLRELIREGVKRAHAGLTGQAA